MHKSANSIWKLAFSLLAFAILAQMAWVIVKPFLPFVIGFLVLCFVGVIYTRARRLYLGGGRGGNDKLIRGR